MSQIKKLLVAFGFLLALVVAPVVSYGQEKDDDDEGKPKDVNVVNTPNVKVINTPNVKITNTPDVRDADNPARQPVQAQAFCSANNVLDCSATIYTVPQGKRLVIEFVSTEATLTDGQVAQLTMLTTAGGEENVVHRFPLTPPAVVFQDVGAAIATLGQQVRLYADAGTDVRIKGRRNNTGPAFIANFRFSISGYLLDMQ